MPTIQHQERRARTWCCSLLAAVFMFIPTAASQGSDSLRVPDRALGALSDTGSAAPTQILTKQQMRAIQFENLTDLLRRSSLFIPMRNGSLGQNDALSALGGGAQHLSFGFDGRPMIDLWSGQFNVLQLPPGSIERLEFLYGSDAVGLAPSATLTLLNAQSTVYNTMTPFTSMWYHQGAGDLIAAHVAFSQNVAPGLNIAASVRRAGARGRYQRTDFGLWNVDLQARWAPDTRQNLIVRYGLSTVATQVWGGLDPDVGSTSFEELATVNYDGDKSLHDETRRHDLMATYSNKLAADSSTLLTLQGYVGHQSLLRTQGADLRMLPHDSSGMMNLEGVHTGLVARLEQRIGNLRLRLGSHLQRQDLDSTSRSVAVRAGRTDLFMHGEYVHRSLVFRIASRIHSIMDRIGFSFGGGVAYRTPHLDVRTDLSFAEYEPTPTQRLYADTPESHVLAVVEVGIPALSLRARGYYREITNSASISGGAGLPVISFVTGQQRRTAGLSAMAMLSVGNLELRPRMRYEQDLSTTDSSLASFAMLDVDLAYVLRTPSNSVRIGVSGAWMPASVLPSYEPLVWMFRQGAGQAPSQMDGLSAYVTALIGNASIRASYENILGNRWYTVLNAPELSRVFRLSIDWSFTD